MDRLKKIVEIVMTFLAPIIGQIYYGHEFANLYFPKPALDMFERAYRLYNEKRYDHCLIEVWKHIEGTAIELEDIEVNFKCSCLTYTIRRSIPTYYLDSSFLGKLNIGIEEVITHGKVSGALGSRPE